MICAEAKQKPSDHKRLHLSSKAAIEEKVHTLNLKIVLIHIKYPDLVQRSNLLHGILQISRRYGEDAVQDLAGPLTDVFLDLGKDVREEILPLLPPAVKITNDLFNNPDVINAIEAFPLVKKMIEKWHVRVNTFPRSSPNVPQNVISRQPQAGDKPILDHLQPSALAKDDIPPHPSMLKTKPVDIADKELDLAPPPHPSPSLPSPLPATPQLAKKEYTPPRPPLLETKPVDMAIEELTLARPPHPSQSFPFPVTSTPEPGKAELNLAAPKHLPTRATQSDCTEIMGSPSPLSHTRAELIKLPHSLAPQKPLVATKLDTPSGRRTQYNSMDFNPPI